MGLEEKRMMQDAQTNWVAEAQKYIEQYSTAKPEIEIDWASFGDSKDAIMNMHYNGLGRVWEAVQKAAKDDFAKTAIKEGFKKVVIKNVAEPSQIKVAGAAGVLTIEAAYAKSEYAAVVDIRKAIEGML